MMKKDNVITTLIISVVSLWIVDGVEIVNGNDQALSGVINDGMLIRDDSATNNRLVMNQRLLVNGQDEAFPTNFDSLSDNRINFDTVLGNKSASEPNGIDSLIEILLLAVPCLIIMLFTIIGNILVIVSVFTYRPLKNVANMYMVSLAVADITVSVFVMPFNVIYTIRGKWDFGLFFCKGWLTCDILCCTASILNLCAIAVDRYQAIHDPINYARKRTMNRVVFGIAFVWILSALIAMPPLLGWNDWPDEFTSTTPCTLTSEPGFVIYSSSGTFFIPLIIMTIVYFKIYIATKKRLRKRAEAAQEKINMRSMSTVPASSVSGGNKKSTLGLIKKKKSKGGSFLSPSIGAPSMIQDEMSVNPRRSSSIEDEAQSPKIDQRFEFGNGSKSRKLVSSSGYPVTVTINQASDPTEESESEDEGEKVKSAQVTGQPDSDQEVKRQGKNENKEKICSHLSLTSGRISDKESRDNDTVTKSSSLTQLVQLKANEEAETDFNLDKPEVITPVLGHQLSPVAMKSLLKAPSFGMGQKRKLDRGRFTRNNNHRSSTKSNKSSKSVHIQIIDEGPSIMNIPSTSSATTATSSNRSPSLVPSMSISGNYSSSNYSSTASGATANYIAGNAASVSSLCPPTITPSEATSSSTVNTQVSQIWEEKQRISLSRERKAARVLGIVMG